MDRIGSYHLKKLIARGGMGEVYLAHDSSCGRTIALKKIRSDLADYPHIHKRFLKEAYLTSQLTHPGIIPIYSIHQEQKEIYYTMPYIEGETLKHILRKGITESKKENRPQYPSHSIPSLVRIFVAICQAISYAHAKGILHRDIKPENIIIGKYGEVLVLDWGLAKLVSKDFESEDPAISTLLETDNEMTRVGKVVGTISYMAPEIALGFPATIQTDIYSLGAIFYQMLALRNPFNRGKTIEEFRKKIPKEEFLDPIIVSPHRDIPRLLSRIAAKCLAKEPRERYQTIDELIKDLNIYVEGKSEWFEVSNLRIDQKEDWELRESIVLTDPLAISRETTETEWVNIMISKESFPGNTRIDARVCLAENSLGIGFLLSVPEAISRNRLDEGYCLWLASDLKPTTTLTKSRIEMVSAPEIYLTRNKWIDIRIEKIDQTIHLYIDGKSQFSFMAHIPLPGTHIGVMYKDANFEIDAIKVSVGNLNITESCLAVPDAFLSRRLYQEALSEYKRIASSFHDRAEGREAIFKTGLTYLELAKSSGDYSKLDLGVEEFEKLHHTPSAPLQYLGKALIYQLTKDFEEEIKCYEMAYRRYPNHPQLAIVQEQVVGRMHDVSIKQRNMAYQFILVATQHLPLLALDTHTRRLLNSLTKGWEKLTFIEETNNGTEQRPTHLSMQLAFWLNKPYTLEEILDEILRDLPSSTVDIKNIFWCLFNLELWEQAKSKFELVKEKLTSEDLIEIERDIHCHSMGYRKLADNIFAEQKTFTTFSDLRRTLYWIDRAIDKNELWFVKHCLDLYAHCELNLQQQLALNLRRIWMLLLEKNWNEAGEVLYSYPVEMLNSEATPLFFLYGCWLAATEPKEMYNVHFGGLLQETYPRSWCAAALNVTGKLDDAWRDRALPWELKNFSRYIELFNHCDT